MTLEHTQPLHMASDRLLEPDRAPPALDLVLRFGEFSSQSPSVCPLRNRQFVHNDNEKVNVITEFRP